MSDELDSGTEMANSTNHTAPHILLSEYIRIPAYIVIFIMCVVGNTLVVVTLLQNRRMRTVTNIFLINLSIGGVVCMPVTLTGQMLRRFIFGAAMCPIITHLQVVSVAVSTFTLCSISIERYFAICCPLTSRRWQTVSHSIKMTILCWILAIIVAFPVLLVSRLVPSGQPDEFGNQPHWACREVYPETAPLLTDLREHANVTEGPQPQIPQPATPLEIAYNLFIFISLFGLPGIFMSVAYLKITLTLLRAGVKGNGHNNTARESKAFSSNDPANGSLAKLSNKLARFRTGSNGHQSIRDVRNGSAAGLSHSATLGEDDEPMDTDTPLGAVTSPVESSYGQQDGVRSTHSERNLQAKKRVVLMLIIVVFEFFICFTPVWLVTVFRTIDPVAVGDLVGDVGITYLQLLMYISTCCNPITYCFLHSKFREGMIQAFKCKKNKPELSDLLRSRTTKPTSCRNNDSVSARSLNNSAIAPFAKTTSSKPLAIKKPSIPALTIEGDELADCVATSVNQSSEITWL